MKLKFIACLTVLSLLSITILCSFIDMGKADPKGGIEGYVFPKEAKPFVKIVIPQSSRYADTIHREVHPNANGYYKIPNLENGDYKLIYFTHENGYKRSSQTVTVSNNTMTTAGEITLEKQ